MFINIVCRPAQIFKNVGYLSKMPPGKIVDEVPKVEGELSLESLKFFLQKDNDFT